VELSVTGHWSEGSLVRKVTGPNPNPNRNPIPNPKVVFDLRNKKTLNSFSYVHAVRPLCGPIKPGQGKRSQ